MRSCAAHRNPPWSPAVSDGMATYQERSRHAAPAGRVQPMALLGTTLWAGSWETDRLYAIDVATWAVTDEVAAPGRPYGLTAMAGELRVVISVGEEDDRYLYRFVPGQGFVHGSTPCPELNGSHLASDGTALYLCQATNRRIVELDHKGGVAREIALPTRCAGMGFGPDGFRIISADDDFDHLSFATLDLAQPAPQIGAIAEMPAEARSLVFDGANWWTSLREEGAIVSFTVE